MRLTIVIPTLDEAAHLPRTVASLRRLPGRPRILVADGGSRDETLSVARSLQLEVVRGPAGRARQMNLGADRGGGDVLWFLHADGEVDPGALEAIERALRDPQVVGGSFRLRVAGGGAALGTIARVSNLRARYLGVPYGDQALFVRREAFEAVGGFPDVPFLEDVAIARALRRRGKLVQADAWVRIDTRHWSRLGPVRTTVLNWSMVALYSLGVSPERLAPHYRRHPRRGERPAGGGQGTAALLSARQSRARRASSAFG